MARKDRIFPAKNLLVLLTVLALTLASCSNSATVKDNGDTAESQHQSEKIEENTRIPTGLEPQKFDGYEFRFLNFEQFWNNMQLTVEEETADTLNDAIYKRNMTVMEQLNIELAETFPGDPAGQIRNIVASGDSSFDAGYVYASAIGSLVGKSTQKYVYDFAVDVPYVDLEKPWWTQSANASLSLANRQYFAVNDISLSYFDSVMPLVMNMRIAADHNLGNVYELVRKGGWTMDVMGQMMRTVSGDLNGDGDYTLKEDRFGMFGMSEEYVALVIAGGGNIIKKDQNDIPYFAVGEESFINAFAKAIEILNVEGVFANFRLPKYKVDGGDLSTFTEGRALFFSDVLFWISGMRSMEDDFAILPRAKLTEQQKNYYSYCHESSALLCIPITADAERSGYIIETLAAESHYTVIPAYYEVVLSQKFARDEDSIEMLDIIFASRVSDLGCVFNWSNIYTSLRQMGEQGNADIASLAARVQKSIEKSIADLLPDDIG
jgi:hypothetical protein